MKRGFTIVETAITMGISVIALIALVNLLFIFNSTYGYQQAFIAAAGSAGKAMNAIESSVLQADRVLSSYNFSGTIYSSAATVLVLELPTIDGSGNIISSAKDYAAFYASGTTLYRRVLANVQSARASGITQLSTTLYSLSFAYDNNDFTKVTNVTVDIQTRSQFKQQILQSHLSGQLYLRNMQPSP